MSLRTSKSTHVKLLVYDLNPNQIMGGCTTPIFNNVYRIACGLRPRCVSRVPLVCAAAAGAPGRPQVGSPPATCPLGSECEAEAPAISPLCMRIRTTGGCSCQRHRERRGATRVRPSRCVCLGAWARVSLSVPFVLRLWCRLHNVCVQNLRTFEGHSQSVNALALSPDFGQLGYDHPRVEH
jgi:hypothetical protein